MFLDPKFTKKLLELHIVKFRSTDKKSSGDIFFFNLEFKARGYYHGLKMAMPFVGDYAL